MTKLLEKMIEVMRTLSDEEQDAVARDVLSRIEDGQKWDELLVSDASQAWLVKAAAEALDLHGKGAVLPFVPSDKPA